ncbi:MAG: RNA polymerase-associated protein RapA [Gammaproteobacteria bacterium]|nr:RNA polymerase-associated protein RapA [Gammaproteobacteria bacterium]
MAQFSKGQRWISDTEPDLGLGTIIDQNHRQITVVFLASGETRIYAKETAPLTRIQFAAGDSLTTHDERQLQVRDVIEEDGCLLYQGVLDSGEPAIVAESELSNHLKFNRPQDRLFAGQLDNRQWFNLRANVIQHQHQQQQSLIRGLSGGRVAIIPHQIYIAAEVSSREAPRVLLADEVGLGKTIEAGLILHRQLTTYQISRVLIVVPEALLHQWLVEMLRRFNLQFQIMDANRFEALLPSAPDNNPFLAAQLNLCSLSTLLDNPEIAAAVYAGQFDTLVVDEAHHLEWSPQEATPAYELVEQVARTTPSVLLLTATPEQLGLHGHFARLKLLDSSRFSDFDRFVADEEHFAATADIAEALADDAPLSQAQVQAVEHQLSIELTANETSALIEGSSSDGFELRQRLLSMLIDRHGTSRVLFRNTRSGISGFPSRQLQMHPLEGSDPFVAVLEWLPEQLQSCFPDKVLLIASSVDTVMKLAEGLRQAGINSAQFHEDMSIVERDRAAAWFADDEDGCQLLICSEIGSEGRNFQFLHHLIMIELPATPDVLEQRIGRLDRIGQKHDIQIHIPALPGSRDERLARWYHEGLGAFEKICKVGTAVAAELEDSLTAILTADTLDDLAMSLLIDNTRELTTTFEQRLEQGRDRLLELNSNRTDLISEHLDLLYREERDYTLPDLMNAIFDCFGVESEEQSNRTWIIKPTDHMQVSSFPGVDVDGLTATFHRDTALQREEVTFLTWDHPMVNAGLDLVMNEATGQANAELLETDVLPQGVLYLEMVVTWRCKAEKSLNIDRYFPAGVKRYLLGSNRKDYTGVLGELNLDAMLRRSDRGRLKKVVQDNRADINVLLQYGEKLAADAIPAIVADAQGNIEAELDPELERLRALQKINPAVRTDEIERLEERKQALVNSLSTTDFETVALSILLNP